MYTFIYDQKPSLHPSFRIRHGRTMRSSRPLGADYFWTRGREIARGEHEVPLIRFQGGGVNDPKRQNTTRGGGGIGAKQHRINEILCSKYEIQFLQIDFAQFLF